MSLSLDQIPESRKRNLPTVGMHTTVVLAMSADGKIADVERSAARFGSAEDRAHLEQQVAAADAVLFGAGTLRAYGTTLPVTSASLLAQRQQGGQPPQPVQIVVSRSAQLAPDARFFQQSVPRWLVTTPIGSANWLGKPAFERILTSGPEIHWPLVFAQFEHLGLSKIAVLGGGELVASLFAAQLVNELWLTVCPLILGGQMAPSPVTGAGFLANLAPRLVLLEVRSVNQEVFLHYQVTPPGPQ
jgi:5-amino-6-(5-phosphoribosylamino)uracil reductase